MANLSMMQGRCRTMWEASRDLLEAGHSARCSDTWQRGYRLWVQASVMRAAGEPFCLAPYLAKWMP